MKKPELILFDYGGTLMEEPPFDPRAGSRALLDGGYLDNPDGVTVEDLQTMANAMGHEMGRHFDETSSHVEVHQHVFQRYLYEALNMRPKAPPAVLERVFWDAAGQGTPTEGIMDLLHTIRDMGIRTGVISNITFSGDALAGRINRQMPGHDFSFIIATSEYAYRKPHPRIFQVALRKAGVAAEDAWYCGDSLHFDVGGAKASGLTPVWYTGALAEAAGEAPEGCIRADHWAELGALLTGLA